MSATLITGPINSGKTGRMLDILGRCDPGRTGVIIVPDRETAGELRRRFAAASKGRHQAMRTDAIQDWSGFVRGLASPLLPVAKQQHSILVILGILGKLKLPYFGATATSYATAVGFARTIIALKENLIKPDELGSIISGIGEPCHRERDLINVYEAYEKELSRKGLLDEGDLTILAIKNAVEGAASLADMQAVMFDEFAMPTPAQIAMIRALGAGLKKASIFVACPVAASEDERPFASWLSRARDAWLSAIEDEETLEAQPAITPQISVLKAGSPQQEARHIALMVSNEKLPARDVVVASRRGDTFMEWYLSEAHAMDLLPEHPTLDGAMGAALAHEIISAESIEGLPREAEIPVFVQEMRKLASVKDRARSWIAGLKERKGHGRIAARSLTAAEIIKEVLRALSVSSDFLGACRLTREQFAQLISHELCRHAAAATMLESVLPFRNHTFSTPLASEASCLIMARMIEGSFPSRSAEGLFFGDWKEESIRRIFPDAEDAHAAESYAFETMIRKCRGRLVLMMPAVTDSGSETIPSPFADRFLAQDERPQILAPHVLCSVGSGRSEKEMHRLFAVESARIAGNDILDSPCANYMGVLSSPESQRLVRERFVKAELNPTSLERYSNCPFSFFAQDVLRTAEQPEETPQIRATDRGRLVHEVLTRFYRDHLKEAIAARNEPQAVERIEHAVKKIALEIWAERKDALGYVKPGLRERETQEIGKMAMCVIASELDEARHVKSPLIPREFEWEFSNAKGNALEIKIKGDEPLLIRGRVDRIDTDSDGSRFLVIDYKTGNEDQVVSRIESGRHLQLPLYICAVKKSLYPDAAPMGGLMVEIKEATPAGDEKKTNGKTKGLVLADYDGACYRVGRAKSKMDEGRMSELLDAAEEKSAEFASNIRMGMFPASSEADCEFCDYGDICRHKKVSAD